MMLKQASRKCNLVICRRISDFRRSEYDGVAIGSLNAVDILDSKGTGHEIDALKERGRFENGERQRETDMHRIATRLSLPFRRRCARPAINRRSRRTLRSRRVAAATRRHEPGVRHRNLDRRCTFADVAAKQGLHAKWEPHPFKRSVHGASCRPFSRRPRRTKRRLPDQRRATMKRPCRRDTPPTARNQYRSQRMPVR